LLDARVLVAEAITVDHTVTDVAGRR